MMNIKNDSEGSYSVDGNRAEGIRNNLVLYGKGSDLLHRFYECEKMSY